MKPNSTDSLISWNSVLSFQGISTVTAIIHFAQFVAVLALYYQKFINIPRDMVFVSGLVKLNFPNHMIHKTNGAFNNGEKTQCQDALDVINSPEYMASPHWNNGDVNIPGLIDTTNTTFVIFMDHSIDYSLNMSFLVFFFFLFSSLFQIFNVYYLSYNPHGPRYIQYFEYSVSAGLTLVILGLNVGIQDFLTIITLFGLFFGMNIFGAVAEFMVYVVEEIIKQEIKQEEFLRNNPMLPYMWLIPHICGWVLFFFAWIPITIKFYKIQGCAENSQGHGVPWFILVGNIVESLCYFGFGILQLWVLLGRTYQFNKIKVDKIDKVDGWKEKLDYGTVFLSLFAKTFLAWVLLGPILSSNLV